MFRGIGSGYAHSMELSDAYRVLEVEEGASREVVREARNVLVRVWHPDRHQGDRTLHQRADSKLKQINEAYDAIEAAGFPRAVTRPPPPHETPPSDQAPSTPPPQQASPPMPPPTPPQRGGQTTTSSNSSSGVLALFVCVAVAVLIGIYVHQNDKPSESRYETSVRYEQPQQNSYQPLTDPPVRVDPVASPEPVPIPTPAAKPPFTLGSSHEDVVAAQGTPTSIDKSMGETWWYDGSRIEFRGGKVYEWHALPFARLNFILKPSSEQAADAARERGYFTLGGGKDEVLALEGTPTAIDRTIGETWWFDGSRIEFREGKVSEWHMSPMQARFHVTLHPRDPAVAASAKARGTYGPNASKDEVLGVEGTPTALDVSFGETWWYGGSRIEFRNGRISEYHSSPMSRLNVSTEP